MRKPFVKCCCILIMVCSLIAVSFIPSFAAAAADVPVSSLELSSEVFDFDVNGAWSSLSYDLSLYSSDMFVGSLWWNTATPMLLNTKYSVSSSSTFANSVPLGPYTCYFYFYPYVSGSHMYWELRFYNCSGSTLYFRYADCFVTLAGSVNSSSGGSTIIPVSNNSSVNLERFEPSLCADGNIVFSDSFFNVPLNTSMTLVYMCLTSVGFGSNEVSVSSGLSPVVPCRNYTDFYCYSVTSFSYGSIDSDYLSLVSNRSDLNSNICFNFLVNGEVVSDSYGNESVVVGGGSNPDNPSGGFSTSTGTVTPEYDSNGNIVNYDFNIITDNTDVINALDGFGDSLSTPTEDPPSVIESEELDDYTSAVEQSDQALDSFKGNHSFSNLWSNFNLTSFQTSLSFWRDRFDDVTGTDPVFPVVVASMLSFGLIAVILNRRVGN